MRQRQKIQTLLSALTPATRFEASGMRLESETINSRMNKAI